VLCCGSGIRLYVGGSLYAAVGFWVLRARQHGVAADRAGHVEAGITRKHTLANSLRLMHAGAATTVTGSADLPIPKRGIAKQRTSFNSERALAGM
jgi:hypothetical protein